MQSHNMQRMSDALTPNSPSRFEPSVCPFVICYVFSACNNCNDPNVKVEGRSSKLYFENKRSSVAQISKHGGIEYSICLSVDTRLHLTQILDCKQAMLIEEP